MSNLGIVQAVRHILDRTWGRRDNGYVHYHVDKSTGQDI